MTSVSATSAQALPRIGGFELDEDSVRALQQGVAVVAAKWSVSVLAQLAGGTRRFNELLRRIEGVSRRMLSATLRQLERDGLIDRRVYARVPARVEYRLSPAGEELLEALAPLVGWSLSHRETLDAARARFDAGQRTWRDETEQLKARSRPTPRIV